MHWSDLNHDHRPDLVLVFRNDSGQSTQEPASHHHAVLMNDCGKGSDGEQQEEGKGLRDAAVSFQVLYGPAVGLQATPAVWGLSTQLADVNGDYDDDFCQYSCQQLGTDRCRCALQCSINAAQEPAASGQPVPPLSFVALQPVTVELDCSASQPLSTALIASDTDVDGVVNLLCLHGSEELSIRSFSLFPASAAAAAKLRPTDWVDLPLPSSLPIAASSKLTCLQQQRSDNASQAAALEASSGGPCVMISRQDFALSVASDSPSPSVSPSSSNPLASDACVALLLSDLNGAGPAELLCFGPVFPSQIRIFQPRRGGMVEVTQDMRPQLRSTAPRRKPASPSLSIRHACMADLNADELPDYVLATADSGVAVALSDDQGDYVLSKLPPGRIHGLVSGQCWGSGCAVGWPVWTRTTTARWTSSLSTASLWPCTTTRTLWAWTFALCSCQASLTTLRSTAATVSSLQPASHSRTSTTTAGWT